MARSAAVPSLFVVARYKPSVINTIKQSAAALGILRLLHCCHVGKLLLLVLILAQIAFTQSVAGLPPFGSFSRSQTDVVNLANANVHIEVPLAHKAGRGIPFDYLWSYDSTVWTPLAGKWVAAPNWGWRSVSETRVGYITYKTATTSCGNTAYISWTYVDAGGTAHLASSPGFGVGNCLPNYPAQATFTLTDGSGYVLTVNNIPGVVSLYDTSGDQITAPLFNVTTGPPPNPNGIGSVTDPNGNAATVSTGGYSFIDTSGAAVLTASAVFNCPPEFPSCQRTYQYTGPQNTVETITVTYRSFTVATGFNCVGLTEFPATSERLVYSIGLANGTSYIFHYEPTPNQTGHVTGRISQVDLPTGGSISYTYTGGNQGSFCADGTTATLTRTANGGSWTYTRNAAGTQTTVGDPAGNQTVLQISGGAIVMRTVHQGPTTGPVLRTVTTCYNTTTAASCTAAQGPVANKAVLAITVSTQLDTAVTAKTVTFFNQYTLPTEIDTYDYGASSPFRRKVITYASPGNNIHNRVACVQLTAGTAPTACGQVTTDTASLTNYLNYDAHGNVGTIQQWVSGSTFVSQGFTYYSTGLVQTATDVNGAQATYTYGTCNSSFPTAVSMPLGLSRSMTWDCNGGVPTSVTDENGKTTTYSYVNPTTGVGDPLWRLTRTTLPDGGQTTTTFNDIASPANIITSQLISAGTSFTTQTNLDGLGRPVQKMLTSDPAAIDYTDITYDTSGRLHSISNPYRTLSDPTYGLTSYTYDALDRVTSITEPGGATILKTYAGRAVQVQDEGNGNGTTRVTKIYQSDALGQLTSTCEVSAVAVVGVAGTPSSCLLDIAGVGFLSTYHFTPLGKVDGRGQTGMNPNARTYFYDGLGRLTSDKSPEVGTVTYTYDTNSLGDLYQRTSPKPNQTVFTTTVTSTYSHDVLHRLTGVTYNDGVTNRTTYNYDEGVALGATIQNPKGRLTSQWVFNGSGTAVAGAAYSYDAVGRVAYQGSCAPDTCAGTPIALNYTYDLAGNLLTATSGAGWNYNYTYDAANRLMLLTTNLVDSNHPGTLMSNLQYNALGMETAATFGDGTSLHGITEARAYDTRGRQNSLTSTIIGGSGVYNMVGVSYAPNNDLLSVADSALGGTWSYSYDDINRLKTTNGVGSNYGTVGYSYDYDRYANRWHQNVTAGTGFGSILSFDSANHVAAGNGYTYDAAGNVSSFNDGVGHTYNYTYDAEGRMLAVSGATSANYVYDAAGRRVQSTVNGSTVDFAYDLAGREVVKYAAGVFRRLEVYHPNNGRHLVTYVNGLTFFDFQDQVGTERVKITQDGTHYESTRSIPFGDGQVGSGPDLGLTGPDHFTGQELDSESNLTHFWFRQFSAIQGRWMSPDPAGATAENLADPQSWNRYVYALNNPVNLFDPLGLDTCPAGSYGSCVDVVATDPGGDGGGDGGGTGVKQPEKPTGGGEKGGGGGGGTHLRKAGQTVSQCLQDNMSKFSLVGIADSLLGTNARDTFIGNLVGGNDVTGVASIFTGDDPTGSLASAVSETAENGIQQGIGVPLRIGGNTAPAFQTLFPRLGRPAQALLRSKGLSTAIGTVADVFDFKLEVDVVLTVALLAACR